MTNKKRNEMFENNIGLVYKVAYSMNFGNSELDDMIQNGSIGLLDAIKKWDSKKGAFSTFSFQYIKFYILRGLKKFDLNQPFRIPIYIYEDKELLKNCRVTTLNLDKKVKEEGSMSYSDAIEDKNSAIDLFIKKTEILDLLNECFELLNPKERYILYGRYFEDKTLRDLGEELNLTKERIRQIQFKAIGKIRSSKNEN
ncbi:MAG: sigma-70 family RNA polymerase sigma factor [Fusobacteriaceae bacterium]